MFSASSTLSNTLEILVCRYVQLQMRRDMCFLPAVRTLSNTLVILACTATDKKINVCSVSSTLSNTLEVLASTAAPEEYIRETCSASSTLRNTLEILVCTAAEEKRSVFCQQYLH